MTLLERHTQLAELVAARRDANAGQGSIVLVIGEAGAGKTALIKQFAAEPMPSRAADGGSPVLWGLCDELVTPRPLGPFRDMFGWLDLGVVGATSLPDVGRPRARSRLPGQPGGVIDLLGAIAAELDRPPHPTVAVVEDAHWADAASLDAIRFIGRRIARLRALLIVSYREDEAPPDHPLRLALGAIPPDDVRRIRLPPLSPSAVATLAGRPEVDDLYALTNGNPFYVRELLATPEAAVPATVQDAVMARVARLNPAARDCVEVVSTIPGPAELWLLAGCGVSDGVDEAARYGVLTVDEESVRFEHEIARRAVEHSLPERQRQQINESLVELLVAHSADPARITHHAVHAGRGDTVATYAPVAARHAAEVDGHQEAVDHFARALEHAERFTPDEFLDLAEGFVASAMEIARYDDAQPRANQAIDICRAEGDQARLGRLLGRLAYIERARGQGAGADAALREAISVLEAHPVGPDLVDVYAEQSRVAMLNHQPADAIQWGQRAIELSQNLGSTAPQCSAMVTVGTARIQRDPDDTAPLIEALDVAVAHNDVHAAARAYVNLSAEFTATMRYEDAQRLIERGLEFSEAHDQLASLGYLLSNRAHCHLDQGAWTEAERDARHACAHDYGAFREAHLVNALVQVRRGDATAAATLSQVAAQAERSKEAQIVIPAALAHAEFAWLHGDLDGVAEAVRPVEDIVLESQFGPWVGRTALWQRRAGRLTEVPDSAGDPYVLALAGQWQEAAAYWERVGRPYEQADALADAPHPEAKLSALEILDGLGAVPRATMVRRDLAGLGVQSVPRGPRTTTLASPAGLTARQTEVLELLAQRLTYQQIAERLHVSVKTVDHHVAAVRTKLDVTTRDDAVVVGRRLGIVPPEDGDGNTVR